MKKDIWKYIFHSVSRFYSSLRDKCALRVINGLADWIAQQRPGPFSSNTPTCNVFIADFIELNNFEFSRVVVQLNYKISMNECNSIDDNCNSDDEIDNEIWQKVNFGCFLCAPWYWEAYQKRIETIRNSFVTEFRITVILGDAHNSRLSFSYDVPNYKPLIIQTKLLTSLCAHCNETNF